MKTDAILYDYAMRLVGLPYIWGGDDAVSGFDCSGLVLELLQAGAAWAVGDTNAAGLFAAFKDTVTLPDAAFGDLAFYGTGKPTHVAFCLGELLMLEAGGGGAKTISREAAARDNAFVRVRPIKRRADLLGLRRPHYPWSAA